MALVEFTADDGQRLSGTFCRAEHARTAVVLAHGITADREEHGVFTSLAMELQSLGVSSLRFDFRGHGQSSGDPVAMTVAGETSDLAAAIRTTRELSGDPPRLGIIAASFATASTAWLLTRDPRAVDFVVLLNPVLDMERTFTRPELPWARRSFTPEAMTGLIDTGRVLIDQRFPVGPELVDEMSRGPQPQTGLRLVDVPILVVHGSSDTYVSYEIAKEFALRHPRATLVTVEDGEHGFRRVEEARTVIDAALGWLRSIDAGVA